MSAPTTQRPGAGRAAAAQPMRAARERTGAGPIGWVGPLLAVLLTLVGLVLLRDGVFAPPGVDGASGWPAGQPSWTGAAVSALDGVGRASWMVAVGVFLVLVGLYLLGVALRRRTHRSIALKGVSGAHLMPSDVARRAAAAAEDVDGVLDSSASASRRSVTVTVTTTGGAQGVRDRVSAAVAESLAGLKRLPAVKVTARTDHRKEDLA